MHTAQPQPRRLPGAAVPLTLALLLGLAVPAQAQHEWDTWGMGSDTCVRNANYSLSYVASDGRAGTLVHFDAAGPRLAGPSGNAATSAISDAQGRLLFHSNGRYVYDRLGRVMPNGARLSVNKEDAAAQVLMSRASAICPVPGHADQYYLFYYRGAAWPDPTDTLSVRPVLTYAVVDMRLNGGYGAVVRRDVRLLQPNSLKLALLRHPNQRDYWLVTTAYPARGYLSYRIDPTGIAATPVASLAGEAAYANGFVMRASPDGQFLVSEGTLPYDETPGRIRVQHGLYRYDFDGFSGRLSRETLLHEAAPFYQPQLDVRRYDRYSYLQFFDGASFSPNGRVLYTVEELYQPDPLAGPGAAMLAATAVCQYNLQQPTDEAVRLSRRELLLSRIGVDDYGGYFDAQLAPDSTLWVFDSATLPNTTYRDPLCGGPKAVTVIRYPNQVGPACGVARQAFRLGPRIVWSNQLPNLVVNMLYPPTGLLAQVGCGADSVRLWANSQQTGPAGRWDFGDPASGAANYAAGYVGTHRYARAGTYAVRLTYPSGRVLTREVQVPTGAADFTQANVFTPNGDGLNDAFWPVLGGAGLPDARLRVFSRWGQLVYEMAAPLPRWDGAAAAAGEYFYALDFTDCQGQAQRRHGVVTLVR